MFVNIESIFIFPLSDSTMEWPETNNFFIFIFPPFVFNYPYLTSKYFSTDNSPFIVSASKYSAATLLILYEPESDKTFALAFPYIFESI